MKRAVASLAALVLPSIVGAATPACGGSEATPEPPADAGPDTGRRPAAFDASDDADAGAPADDRHVISLSSSSVIEAETSLAMAPDGTLASVWIAVYGGGSSDIGYAFSKDRGATWSKPGFTGDDAGRDSSDPVVAAAADGSFYTTWIAFHRDSQGATDFVLYVAKAAPGATRFDAPVVADTFPSGDKPWIRITKAGTILVGYMVEDAGNRALRVARSADGAAWSTATAYAVPGGSFANFAIPCTDATSSRVWLAYLEADQGAIAQRVRWSDDDAVTWPDANVGTVSTGSGGVTTVPEPATCATSGADLWVGYGVWTKQPKAADQAPDAYRVARTSDGATFQTVTATDGAAKLVALGDLVAEDASTLSLTYYSGTSDGDFDGAVRRVRSTDGGKTWNKSQTVGAPLYFTVDRGSARWLGDYLGTAARDGTLYVSYGDNGGADRVTHISFATLAP